MLTPDFSRLGAYEMHVGRTIKNVKNPAAV